MCLLNMNLFFNCESATPDLNGMVSSLPIMLGALPISPGTLPNIMVRGLTIPYYTKEDIKVWGCRLCHFLDHII